jgi:hypothetical protein
MSCARTFIPACESLRAHLVTRIRQPQEITGENFFSDDPAWPGNPREWVAVNLHPASGDAPGYRVEDDSGTGDITMKVKGFYVALCLLWLSGVALSQAPKAEDWTPLHEAVLNRCSGKVSRVSAY